MPYVWKKNERKSFDYFDEPRLHMESLLKTHLIELDALSIRILIPLESAGIRTLGDLVNYEHAKLKTIPQLGKISIKKIDKMLDWLDLSMK